MSKELMKAAGTELSVMNSLLVDFLSLQGLDAVAIPADAPEVALDNFSRLIEGENRFRLIERPVYGAEIWYRRNKVDEATGEVMTNDDGTPIRESHVLRFRAGAPLYTPADLAGWDREKPRRFIAMLTYNYGTRRVEVLVVASKMLFEQMWGILRQGDDKPNPFRCDFTITKKFDRKANIGGQVMDIYTYTTRQGKEKDAPEEVIVAIQGMPFRPNLDAMFDGLDPFALTEYEELPTESAAQADGSKALNAAKEAVA